MSETNPLPRLGEAVTRLWNPVPVEHRYYSPDDVYEMLDAAEPERG